MTEIYIVESITCARDCGFSHNECTKYRATKGDKMYKKPTSVFLNFIGTNFRDKKTLRSNQFRLNRQRKH